MAREAQEPKSPRSKRAWRCSCRKRRPDYLRRTVGLGRIAWGLRASVTDGKVGVDPGLAFALSGVRLALESAAALPVPASGGPFRIVMRASNNETNSIVSLTTTVALEPANGAAVGMDALVIATASGSGNNLQVTQDDSLFLADGTHAHTGQHFQDPDGRWHFDGAALH